MDAYLISKFLLLYFFKFRLKTLLFTIFLLNFNSRIISVHCDDLTATSRPVSVYERPNNYRLHEIENIESKFRVSDDTIIRTQESRDLGAKYLNDTVLPSNHFCLKWCWETPSCNTVVFDEKSKKICYLFDCGSPSDFLCKFTSHNSFTSSILKITQHSYDLNQWGIEEKHAKELSSIREPIKVNTTVSSMVTEAKSVPPTPATSNQRVEPPKPETICHHYQFQCINSTECIAIYNVCDGIPQCPDGSDESVDLQCSRKGVSNVMSNPHTTIPQVHPESAINVKENSGMKMSPKKLNIAPTVHIPRKIPMSRITHKQRIQNMNSGNVETKSGWPERVPASQAISPNSQNRADESDGLGTPFIHKHSKFMAANDPHTHNMDRWANDYDQYPSRQSMPVDQRYDPYEHIDDRYLQNALPLDYDNGYRPEDISYWPAQESIRDGSYQSDDFQQQNYSPLSKQSDFADPENLFVPQQITRTSDPYIESKHHYLQKPVDVFPSLPQDDTLENEGYKVRKLPIQRRPPYVNYGDFPQRQYSGYPPSIKSKMYEPSPESKASTFISDAAIKASIMNQMPIKSSHLSNIAENMHRSAAKTVAPQVASKPKATVDQNKAKESPKVPEKASHPEHVKKTVMDFKMSVSEMYSSSRTHTREANSSILALVMGLTVTAVLFVVLACRTKSLRRRMSRKGRSLAHDADYLVNGMYL